MTALLNPNARRRSIFAEGIKETGIGAKFRQNTSFKSPVIKRKVREYFPRKQMPAKQTAVDSGGGWGIFHLLEGVWRAVPSRHGAEY